MISTYCVRQNSNLSVCYTHARTHPHSRLQCRCLAAVLSIMVEEYVEKAALASKYNIKVDGTIIIREMEARLSCLIRVVF